MADPVGGSTPTPAEIARSLSPTMRDALRQATNDRSLRGTVPQPTRQALESRGLLCGGRVLLTDLGRAVRAVLMLDGARDV